MSRPSDPALSSPAQPVEPLAGDEVHIWLVDPDAITDPALLARYAELLNPEEVARRDRYRFDKLKHDFLVARALVRTTLSRYAAVRPAAWQFEANQYGRPEIHSPAIGGRLRFNLSHTRGLAAVAVTWDRDLGVDVESIDRRNSTLQIARRFFAPAEVDELMSFPRGEQGRRFFDYWTLKESYIKARGMGLALPLDQFAFCTQARPHVTIAFTPPLEDDPAAWQFFQDTPSPRHRLALGIRHPAHDRLRVTTRWTTPLVD
ncbi:MAG: 4'-phosphopantetheinyl transferase superfamily protein [Planctomycetaceae bacterium]|nr:4'-phosphopantetheinyl transferase superfamily protein [Planctomycetaceae bacterium]